MSGAVKSVYEIEVAWVKVSPLLNEFKSGDDIPDEWIKKHGGIEPRRLEDRIRGFFEKKQIKSARRGPVVHLLTAEEHAETVGAHEKKAKRQHGKAYKSAVTLDMSKLPVAIVNRVDHQRQRALFHLDAIEKDQREQRTLTGAPIPNPRPRLVNGE